MAQALPSRTPSSDATRRALIDAATSVFAEQGYDGGSVRQITRRADANQAAITYHFGGKEGLYRAVLETAVETFDDQGDFDEASAAHADLAQALRLAMRHFLRPLVRQDRLGRYVQIFGHETANPSPVFRAFFAEKRPRAFKAAERLIRRVLPPGSSDQEVSLHTFWLTQQPIAFVRSASRLREPPFGLTFDDAGVERIVEMLVGLSLGALTGRQPDHPIGNGR